MIPPPKSLSTVQAFLNITDFN